MDHPLLGQYQKRLGGLQTNKIRIRRLRRFYERAIQRISGEWSKDSPTGEEFQVAGHPYAADLNVFGEGSLFQLLCMVRTAVGQRGLARYLLGNPTVEEILLRQAAIRELRDQIQLREHIALLGDWESSQLQWKTFEDWLDLPSPPGNRPLRIILLASAITMALSLMAGAFHLAPWPLILRWMIPLAAFQAVSGLIWRARLNRLLAWLHPIAVEIRILQQGLQLLAGSTFQCEKLRQLTSRAEKSPQAVRRLSLWLNMLDERNKDWFYVPSLLVLTGTQLYLAIEHWRAEHGQVLRDWLDVWAEFEALNALANYAYENPDNTFPEILGGPAQFDAAELGHPLLPFPVCVRNNLQLNRDLRFYIVSGSNMSGKSTLLRAIGLNTVLAYSGAPVRAAALRLSRLSIRASLAVVDSLANGKSKFMAEIDRLRQAIETAQQGEAVLFLVDEIFSGTNSRDRRVAAEAVIQTLVTSGAIGLVSTHDLALTEIATRELRGINVHTGSKDGSDPMDFDYLIKALFEALNERGLEEQEALTEHCIRVNQLEDESQTLAREGVADGFLHEKDPIELMRQTAIFDHFELAGDRCENVADRVANVLAKNS